MGADIEDFLKADAKQVEIDLSKVRINQERTERHIRRKDPKLLLEAAPPTSFIHDVLWQDNTMFPTNYSSFSLREPSCMDLSSIHRWIIGVYLDGTALNQF